MVEQGQCIACPRSPIRGPEKPRTTLQVAGLLSKLLITPLSDQLRALSRGEPMLLIKNREREKAQPASLSLFCRHCSRRSWAYSRSAAMRVHRSAWSIRLSLRTGRWFLLPARNIAARALCTLWDRPTCAPPLGYYSLSIAKSRGVARPGWCSAKSEPGTQLFPRSFPWQPIEQVRPPIG